MSKAQTNLLNFIFRMGDNNLILGQQLSAWCGHAPTLEEDIATANIALDLIGQATNWLTYAGQTEGQGRTADDLAFLRHEREFQNALLVEQPNGDFGNTLMRQFLFDSWHYYISRALTKSNDAGIREIAEKSIKEVTYHVERSSELVAKLGDGSDESHGYMQRALANLWRFSGELFVADGSDQNLADAGIIPVLTELKPDFTTFVDSVLSRAGLIKPAPTFMQTGGKQGLHSEAMGPLLAQMQYLQRTYPDASW